MGEPLTPHMRWWGWGSDEHDGPLPSAADELLRTELGVSGPRRTPVPLARVALPEAKLPDQVRDRLAAVVGDAHVRGDRLARVAHAAGRSYPDLVRLRSGELGTAPDAVVEPGSGEEVAAVLSACVEAGVAVVPYGGGTSVVGGVEALRGGRDAAISLDLRRLSGLVKLDPRSRLATIGAGTLGPAAEHALGARGLTLGHFPQSFEFSTVGGWVATRSAGQASTGYGRIDELVRSLRVATPSGWIEPRTVPATAAGPDLRALLVGSEGTLGVITEATLEVRPRPTERRYEAWSLRTWEAGVDACQELEQAGIAPDLVRLSDPDETRVSLALASSAAAAALQRYLLLRGRAGGCLAILGFEGVEVRSRRAAAARLLRARGAMSLGTAPGRSWERARFHGPYLRDELLARGVMVDTLETATSWSNALDLYARVRATLAEAMAAAGTPGVVMCHVSHLYRSGCSLYYTFLARQLPGAELEQWNAIKVAAGDAIAAGGGTITHHHAVGRDHAPWLEAEVGRGGIELLRAAKAALDPEGIMNPGKLIDAGPLPGSAGTAGAVADDTTVEAPNGP